ncbi:MAG TPA: hypothetical protein DCY03_01940 [Planctomycetaceae bacterium]|nr:hypothetical protein [Planctomycetaceae bacterium]
MLPHKIGFVMFGLLSFHFFHSQWEKRHRLSCSESGIPPRRFGMTAPAFQVMLNSWKPSQFYCGEIRANETHSY